MKWPANSEFIKLHDGTVLHDALVIRGFMQDQLQADTTTIFDALRSLGTHSNDEAITSSGSTKWVEGAHPALNYRGNEIPRSKIWLQEDFEEGYRKYGYTGWQWPVAHAARPISSVPCVEEVMDNLNMLGDFDFNQTIATFYKDGNDCIGDHSDKTKDFGVEGKTKEGKTKDTWLCMIKLGDARPFKFTDLAGNVLFNETLPAGTAIFLRATGENAANTLVKHAVPPCESKEPSGSLVFRPIATVIPWPTVNAKIAKRAPVAVHVAPPAVAEPSVDSTRAAKKARKAAKAAAPVAEPPSTFQAILALSQPEQVIELKKLGLDAEQKNGWVYAKKTEWNQPLKFNPDGKKLKKLVEDALAVRLEKQAKALEKQQREEDRRVRAAQAKEVMDFINNGNVALLKDVVRIQQVPIHEYDKIDPDDNRVKYELCFNVAEAHPLVKTLMAESKVSHSLCFLC